MGSIDIGVLGEEVNRVLSHLTVLDGNLFRTNDGCEIHWGNSDRVLHTVRVAEGRDVNALADAVHRPFRLSEGDRARAVLTKTEDGVAYLLVALDHAYGDGQTLALIYEEIFRQYTAHLSGQSEPIVGKSWRSFAAAIAADYRPPATEDERYEYFERMRRAASRVAETRSDHPVKKLRANRHHRMVLSTDHSEAVLTSAWRNKLPLGEAIAAGMAAIQPPDLELPVAFARHGRESARWFRTPGSTYENLFIAPVQKRNSSKGQYQAELASVPRLAGTWVTDYLTPDETYELRRRASSTFPKTRSITVPGAIVTSADDLFLEIFEYTDGQIDQERRYELFIMTWTRDDGRLFMNAHVDHLCIADPAEYIGHLVEAVIAL